jgi:SAM-dependent methyltransferase
LPNPKSKIQNLKWKDHFSKQASAYARHRPHYPPALFEYLASVAPAHNLAWDCGTGNGQAALSLTPYFDRVIATDPSEEQLRNAFPHDKVTYRQAPAENPGLDAQSVDLITVAQALHWFDIDRFFEQVKQALVPGGVIAVWCYALCRITPELDTIIDHFYFDKVGPYWPRERRLVDDMYRSIPFPFNEMQAPSFSIELSWTLDDLLGYLRTWSPTRRFIERNGHDPVSLIEDELASAWGNTQHERTVTWPIYMRIGLMPER